MASFCDLPPEVRELIYHALIVDPLRDGDRIMFTLDQDGESNWNRTTELPPPEDELVADGKPASIESCVKHLNNTELWSLAKISKLLYTEATPIIYANTNVEYTFGDSFGINDSLTLLHTFLGKLPPASCVLIRHLTIINNKSGAGKFLSAKDMNIIVKLLNRKLPNLSSLQIRANDPMTEPWIDGNVPQFVIEFLSIMAAARPVARLVSRPTVTLKPRICFFLELDTFVFDPKITMSMRIMQGLMLREVMPTLIAITDWRQQAREYHAMACQQDDYLQLTSVIRPGVGGDLQTATVAEIGNMKARLTNREKVMKQIADCKHWNMILGRLLHRSSS
ncbi:hypothetical protein QM012_007352 [Aureobasidium pullulans]|uniref:F-box domain-containing protein n=1 Tax=Aureobasidium pullulans TaxID=5580 RepID=A0ABR0TP47_AURPU